MLYGGLATCFNERKGKPDPAALAVMAEWKSPHGYARRVKYLFNGGDGHNKKYRLKGKDRQDAVVDTLFGDGEQDWFIVHAEDLTPDIDPLTETKTAL